MMYSWLHLSSCIIAQDGENINNYVEVVGDALDSAISAARARLLSDNGTLTEKERVVLIQKLDSLL